jgi:hypothetical protein
MLKHEPASMLNETYQKISALLHETKQCMWYTIILCHFCAIL